jgi:hypothetical protein
VFSKTDFGDLGADAAIRKSLSRFCEKETIRRIAAGLYEYPQYSEMLQSLLLPDQDAVAQAIARKYSWHIQPSGAAAANYFGITTQVPGRLLYYSDGPDRSIKTAFYIVEFKKTALKESKLKLPESGLIVQALKEIGQQHISAEILNKIRKKIKPELYPRIIRDTRSVTAWIRDIILQICKEGADATT